jgi:hypothetical protein
MVFGAAQADQPRAWRVFGCEGDPLNQAWAGGFWGLSDHNWAEAQEFVVDQPGGEEGAVDSRTTFAEQVLNAVFGFQFAHHGVQVNRFLAKLEHVQLALVRDGSGVRASGFGGTDDDVQVWSGEHGGIRVAFAVRGQENLDRFGTQTEFGPPCLECGRIRWADEPRVPNVVGFDLQGHVTDNHGIGSGTQESHQPSVVFLKIADISATDLTRNRETDATISRGHKVDEGVRAIPRVWRMPIAAVSVTPMLGNAGCGSSFQIETDFKRASGANWSRNIGLGRHEPIYRRFQVSISARAYGVGSTARLNSG